MGLPLTWITLSLVHLFWGKHAERAQGPLRQPFRLCGDDLIGLFTPKMDKQYTEIVLKCGGAFSAGKHFKSDKFGCFTEEIFEVEHSTYKYNSTKMVMAEIKV